MAQPAGSVEDPGDLTGLQRVVRRRTIGVRKFMSSVGALARLGLGATRRAGQALRRVVLSDRERPASHL